jgi:VanZ family protein
MIKNDRTHRWKKATGWLLAAYWLALILGTHLPHPPQSMVASDKSLHFSAYAGLAFLVSWNWSLRRALGWRQRIWIFVVLAAFGAIDEITQIPVGRQCDLFDWTADVLGILAGSLLFLATIAVFRRPGLRPRET